MNDRAVTKPLAPNAEGPLVLRVQILLDRANFSVGQIDGRIGINTLRALLGFRTVRGLPQGIGVDDPIWKALSENADPALISYAITGDDLKGPFARVPIDMMSKAKLTYLGYASPLDEIAEKFHISPGLLQKLNPGKTFRVAGEQLLVPNVLQQPSTQAAQIVVSESDSTVTAFDAGGKPIAQFPATIGSDHDPLPIGQWKINGVFRNPKFHYNPELFWDAKPEHAKATIAPGPRNPVGVVWIDLSKEHYGIHGTPDPSRIGSSESHGCIRLTNWDAMKLAGMVKPGTPAILQERSALAPPAYSAAAPSIATPVAETETIGLPVLGMHVSDLRDTFSQSRDHNRRHEATDIVAPRGTPVLAVEDGTIRKLFLSRPGGITIYEFDPSEKFCYYYAHLDHYASGLMEGMHVRRGQVIAYVGTTGNAAANTPHLHFAISVLGADKRWWKGIPINPYPILLASAQRLATG